MQQKREELEAYHGINGANRAEAISLGPVKIDTADMHIVKSRVESAYVMNDEQLRRIIKGMDDEKLGHLIYLAVEEQIARGKRSGTKARYVPCSACTRKRWVIGAEDICAKCKGYDRKPAECTQCGAICAPNDPNQTVCGGCKSKSKGKKMPLFAPGTEVTAENPISAVAGTMDAASIGTHTSAETSVVIGIASSKPLCKCGAKLSPTKRPDIVKLCYDCMKIDYFTRFPVVE